MGFAEDLRSEVRNIFASTWQIRDGDKVPETDDVALGNSAVKLSGTVLYADLAESTRMVNKSKSHFAAEVYKTYLLTVCRIIRLHQGEITAFDGDRVMAVFIGKSKNSDAATVALKVNWAVQQIVNEELKRQYADTDFRVKQSLGIDTGELWVARTGIRGSNDLVWVGRAANYAAKLCSLRSDHKVTWITEDVFNALNDPTKYSKGTLMWEKAYWREYERNVYSSTYWWSIE